MQRLLAALAVVIAFLAGRETASEVQARPIVTVQREVIEVPAAAVPCPTAPIAVAEVDADEPEIDDDPDAVDITATAAVRLLETEARLHAALETNLAARGAIFGIARDERSGEAMAGVTVVAEARGAVQTAISDENGYYQITELDPDTYTVTFYYLEMTIERPDVSVAARKSTPVYIKFDEANYLRNIPVPGRTFEGVLNEDGEGVSFSSTTTVENEYIVVE